MTALELRFILEKCFNGTVWCYLEVDGPEWTLPEFYHQN